LKYLLGQLKQLKGLSTMQVQQNLQANTSLKTYAYTFPNHDHRAQSYPHLYGKGVAPVSQSPKQVDSP
jgi:hypothetical protein